MSSNINPMVVTISTKTTYVPLTSSRKEIYLQQRKGEADSKEEKTEREKQSRVRRGKQVKALLLRSNIPRRRSFFKGSNPPHQPWLLFCFLCRVVSFSPSDEPRT